MALEAKPRRLRSYRTSFSYMAAAQCMVLVSMCMRPTNMRSWIISFSAIVPKREPHVLAKQHEEKILCNLEEYGNTSAASIPLALDEVRARAAVQSSRFQGFVPARSQQAPVKTDSPPLVCRTSRSSASNASASSQHLSKRCCRSLLTCLRRSRKAKFSQDCVGQSDRAR